MPREAQTSGVLRFDVFQLDLRAGELYKAGRRVKLQVQPFQVLVILLEHASAVVTREELRRRLWAADTFVDFDHSLNTAVKKLRQALCDDPKKPRFIETLARRGYRFIGCVEEIVPPLPKAKAPESAWVGQVARLCGESNLPFLMLPVDEATAEERDKLEAVNDDVGLSVLIASQKVLMVPTDTQVRVLEVRQPGFRCQVRILDGEHYGKIALVPQKCLAELS